MSSAKIHSIKYPSRTHAHYFFAHHTPHTQSTPNISIQDSNMSEYSSRHSTGQWEFRHFFHAVYEAQTQNTRPSDRKHTHQASQRMLEQSSHAKVCDFDPPRVAPKYARTHIHTHTHTRQHTPSFTTNTKETIHTYMYEYIYVYIYVHTYIHI